MNVLGLTLRAAGLGLALGLATCGLHAQGPRPALDTRAAFMQIVTNFTFQTNAVVVTNYLVVTNAVVITNFFNAQGQPLVAVPPGKPAIPGLIPIPDPKPAGSDPAVVKARQLQALRDLLSQGLLAISNQVSTAGSFASNATRQIQLPQGLTSFDRKKGQALVAAMNLSAEKAAPEAMALLHKAAMQFKTEDPAAVIHGAADAATRLFLATHREELDAPLLALIRRAGGENRLRETYNSVMLRGGGLLGSVLGSGPTVDIEAHVAQGLWAAIVASLTEQEALVRRDASARTTAPLRETFRP